jgi:hypothetical protein
MKNLIRFGVAGALMAGYVTAQAQPLPSTGNSDLWLFVSNQSAQTTFAEDTGISLSSIVPTSSLLPNLSTSGFVLNTSISANFSVNPSNALTAYINAANSAGQTLEWAVEGMQFPTTVTGKGVNKPGGILGLGSAPTSEAGGFGNMVKSPNVETWGNGLQGDLVYLLPTYTAGGSTYAFSAGSTAGQVWGGPPGGGLPGSTNEYGQGPEQSGVGLGTAVGLYAVTGNGVNTSQVQSYVLATNLTLDASGKLSASGAAVPLPAAVWLFGSGLLGLLGVGRRRAVSA